MTIIFHEGLPGAGKTYESVVKRIIPALSKGRKVFAYIEGLDHEKIAEAAGISVERCRELLVVLTRDDVPDVDKKVENDALVVLDEAQNFWPVRYKPTDDRFARFVAEHRRRGLDIVLNGQNVRDVHVLWRRRIDQKVVFTKLDALGKAKKYQWAVFKAVGDDTYEKVSSGFEAYDPKYFGTYLSHEQETENRETFNDSRAVIWNSPIFRKWLPLAFVAGLGGLGYTVYMFRGGLVQQPAKPVVKTETVVTVTKNAVPASAPVAVSVPVPVVSQVKLPPDFVDGLNGKYRPRLTGYARTKGRAQAIIEWYDESNRVRERLTAGQIEEFGWTVQVSEYAEHLILVKGDKRVVATMWPMDPKGMVSREQNLGISAQSSSLGERRLTPIDLQAFPEG